MLGGIAMRPDVLSPGSGHSTVGAANGAHFALLDLSQPSYAVLYQSFTAVAGGIASGQRRDSLFATSFADRSPPALTLDQGLDYASADPMLSAGVDILKSGPDPLSMNSADIAHTDPATVNYSGNDTRPTAYSNYLHGLTSQDLVAGQTSALRFAAAGNAGQALVGIDSVSFDVTPVPEPATCGLLAAGLALIGAATRRRNGTSSFRDFSGVIRVSANFLSQRLPLRLRCHLAHRHTPNRPRLCRARNQWPTGTTLATPSWRKTRPCSTTPAAPRT